MQVLILSAMIFMIFSHTPPLTDAEITSFQHPGASQGASREFSPPYASKKALPGLALSLCHFSLALTSLHSKALVEVLNDVGDSEAPLETKPKGSAPLRFSSQVVHVGHVSQAAWLDAHILLLLLPARQVDALLTAAPPPPPHLPAALRPLQQVGGRHPPALHLLLRRHLAALVIGDEHAGNGDGEGEGTSPPQKPLPGRLPARPPLPHLHLGGECGAVKRGGLPLGQQQQNWCLVELVPRHKQRRHGGLTHTHTEQQFHPGAIPFLTLPVLACRNFWNGNLPLECFPPFC